MASRPGLVEVLSPCGVVRGIYEACQTAALSFPAGMLHEAEYSAFYCLNQVTWNPGAV